MIWLLIEEYGYQKFISLIKYLKANKWFFKINEVFLILIALINFYFSSFKRKI